MLYPILFAPIYKEMVWGGTRMQSQFGRKLPYAHTGESWDISCRPKEMGVVENGPHSGLAFDELIALDRSAFLGHRLYKKENFPLLVKIIDANDDLSIQVHPGGNQGKNEMWYIMDAPPGQSLVIGLAEDASPKSLTETPLSCLHYLPIQKGDIINIPAGLVHALTKGVMIAEIQQNSDTTYRLYDYDRPGLDGKPRQLHIQEGLNVADFQNHHSKESVIGISFAEGKVRFTYYIANPYFAVIKYEICERFTENSNPNAFFIFTCVEGSCEISGSGFETIVLPSSRSIFIPAGLGTYTLCGDCTLLKSFVPNVQGEFIEPLLARGFSLAEVRENTQLSW